MAHHKLHRIHRMHNPNYHRSGFKSYGYVLHKYRITPTRKGPFTAKYVKNRYTLERKDASGTPGDVTANDVQDDLEYICDVSIGTPAQVLQLDFDTGSSDLWVWSTEMKGTPPNASEHTIFNPSKSKTFKKMSGSTWSIQYGDGSQAQGDVGTDQVVIGGLVINNQAVELAKSVSQQLLSGAGDGLLGLAWDSINTVKPTPVHTPPTNLALQHDISQAIFTAHLGNWRDANNPSAGGSFYTFGYIDQDVLTASGISNQSDIWYTPIDNSNGFWQFKSGTATVNGQTVQRPAGNAAIADTGTSLAIVSDDLCDAIYSAIPGATYDNNQQAYIFPNTVTVSQLPAVQFDVGGQLFNLLPEDLIYSDLQNGYMYGGIQSRGNLQFDILGDTFLKSVYAIFDSGKKRFGAVQRTQ